MEVRNVTGIVQVDARSGIAIRPGEWADVPYDTAISLWRFRVVELRNLADVTRYLWREPDGTYLLWMSPFSLGDGYATAAEAMVLALKRQGLKIHVEQCWFHSEVGLELETIKMLHVAHPGPFRVGLCMATPGEFRKLPTPFKIGLTMYEADDPLRNLPEWRHECAVVDLLIVPSGYCQEIFSQFVKVPIKVVPLAVNPVYYVGPQNLKRPKQTFTFGMHGTLVDRKSPLELIELLQKVFPMAQYPDVRLHLKTRLSICGSDQHILPAIRDPRVRVINADWYASRVSGWLSNTLDCYLYPSKGEGFGLPPREAMAAGCPVIFANHTGLVTLANSQYNWPVPVKHLEKSPLGGMWRIPDWDAFADAMMWVYKNREEAYWRAHEGSRWFIENHGADAAARELVSVIGAVDPDTAKHVPVEPAEPLESGAERFHTEFYEQLRQLVPPPGPVVDVGVGEGVLYAELCRRGYNVIGVVLPGRISSITARLEARGIRPRLVEAPLWDADKLGLEGAISVSQSVLQQYRKHEVELILRAMLDIAPLALVSVPTVHYSGSFEEGSILARKGYWEDTLADFEFEAHYYGEGHRYLRAKVLGLDQGRRGTLIRQLAPRGRVLNGTWRPLPSRDAEGLPTRGEKGDA